MFEYLVNLPDAARSVIVMVLIIAVIHLINRA
jgi:hypothetical protein